MAKNENNVFKRCLLRIAKAAPGVRLFRNNVGQAWTGRGMTLQRGQVYHAKGGERVIMEPRPVDFGLLKGSGDGIGWHSRVITPEDVGTRIAQFVSLETKAGEGKASPEQMTWARNVQEAGGIAIITKEPERAAAAFNQLDWVGGPRDG